MDDERASQRRDRGNDPSRVLALSDGVFAIVITLLVLEIHVPDLAAGRSLSDALRELRPSLVAFLISFVVVAIAWTGHRDLFSLVQRMDRTLVWLNMLYLLPLSLVPFGASLLARYDRDPQALGMYGVLLVGVALTRLVAWVYATGKPDLLFAPIDSRSRLAGTALIGVPGLVYAVAVAVADFAPTATLVIFGAIPILYFISIAFVRATAPAESEERNFT